MSKLILTGLCTATLGLGACGYDKQEYNAANTDYNADEGSYADNTADYNAGNGADYNDMGNALDNAGDNATENDGSGNNAVY
jgi:hypothetical protein